MFDESGRQIGIIRNHIPRYNLLRFGIAVAVEHAQQQNCGYQYNHHTTEAYRTTLGFHRLSKGLGADMSYCAAASSIWKPKMKVSTATMIVPVGDGQLIEA